MRIALLSCLALFASCSAAPSPATEAKVTYFVDSDGDGLPDRVARPGDTTELTAWIDTDGDGIPDERVGAIEDKRITR